MHPTAMKPSDHPDFFRMPAPAGRSRESTIRLDADGHFWHAGQRVTHAGLADGLHAWIGRHPDDGRYVLSNGYDWTYFVVDDAPYVVRAVRIEPRGILLALSDGTEEAWNPTESRVGTDDALYATVKRGARGGPYEAKFTRHAQRSLGPCLVEDGAQNPAVMVGGGVQTIGAKGARFG
jgi:uncharacterized protein